MFLTQPVDPHATFEFEKDLERLLREMGRRIVEVVYNRLESERPESLPKRFVDQQQEYSRKNEKTNNRGGIGTLFGTVALRRFSCEPLQEARDDDRSSFSPLERQLGIVGGNATPALAERVRFWRRTTASRRFSNGWPRTTAFRGRWRCSAR